MSTVSVLTGKPDNRQRVTVSSPPGGAPEGKHESMTLAMETMTQQLAQMRADLEAARGETAAERTRANELQARVITEAERRATAEGALAAEQAVSAGLRSQLENDRKNTEQMQETLRQAIQAASKDPVIVRPTETVPPVYEVVVNGRDGNNRMRSLTIKPVKQG